MFSCPSLGVECMFMQRERERRGLMMRSRVLVSIMGLVVARTPHPQCCTVTCPWYNQASFSSSWGGENVLSAALSLFLHNVAFHGRFWCLSGIAFFPAMPNVFIELVPFWGQDQISDHFVLDPEQEDTYAGRSEFWCAQKKYESALFIKTNPCKVIWLLCCTFLLNKSYTYVDCVWTTRNSSSATQTVIMILNANVTGEQLPKKNRCLISNQFWAPTVSDAHSQNGCFFLSSRFAILFRWLRWSDTERELSQLHSWDNWWIQGQAEGLVLWPL